MFDPNYLLFYSQDLVHDLVQEHPNQGQDLDHDQGHAQDQDLQGGVLIADQDPAPVLVPEVHQEEDPTPDQDPEVDPDHQEGEDTAGYILLLWIYLLEK